MTAIKSLHESVACAKKRMSILVMLLFYLQHHFITSMMPTKLTRGGVIMALVEFSQHIMIRWTRNIVGNSVLAVKYEIFIA